MVAIDDDGHPLVKTLLKPIVEKFNVPISLAVIPGAIDGSIDREHLSTKELKDMEKAGFEILSHTYTHPQLATLSEEDIHKEMKLSQDWLLKNGFEGHTAMVYPYGSQNALVGEITRQYYEVGITIDGGLGTYLTPPLKTYELVRVMLPSGVSRIKQEIDKAVQNDGLVIFGMHCWYDDFDPLQVEEVFSYALSSGMDIVTMREAVERFGNIEERIDSKGFETLVDADGETNVGDLFTVENLPTSETKITDYPKNRVTRQRIRHADAQNAGFPFPNGGMLETHYFSDWYVCKQIFEVSPPINPNHNENVREIYYRYVDNNFEWQSEWFSSQTTKTINLNEGWTGYLNYKKDESGKVTIIGQTTVGSDVNLGMLPTGYRPPTTTALPFMINNPDEYPRGEVAFVSNNGNINFRTLILDDRLKEGDIIRINFTFST